jgi:septum formation inhibitor-activating ATPase MinD
MDIATIKDMLEVPILGVIPEDESVKESQRMKNAVVHTHPKSKASKAYRKIAQRILGPEYVRKGEAEDKKENKGFFSRFLDKLGL